MYLYFNLGLSPHANFVIKKNNETFKFTVLKCMRDKNISSDVESSLILTLDTPILNDEEDLQKE